MGAGAERPRGEAATSPGGSFPEVDLKPGDTIFKADEKVEHAIEAAGMTLVAFEGLNSFLEIASYCHFFQVPDLPVESDEPTSGVIVVLTKPWDENTLIQVLNVLLEMRMDPDPPGSRVFFHFYTPYDVPKVLLSMFGSSPRCFFETRALLVARFGHDLKPSMCQQLAAVGMYLSRSYFNERLSFADPRGEEVVERLIREHFLQGEEALEPTNSLLALGCLNGELLRGRAPYRSRWAAVKECDPWPGLVFGPLEKDRPSVIYNPIAQTIRCFQTGREGLLVQANRKLLAHCEEVLGGVSGARGGETESSRNARSGLSSP